MDDETARLEAILFSQHGFVSLQTLKKITLISETDIIRHLKSLKKHLASSGLELIEHNRSYQLVASGKYAADIQAIQGETAPALSQAALEVLAIVAYHQPITKSQIEQIRGVASDQSIKGLLSRELILESHNAAKTQTTYQTTGKFLQRLGLNSIEELPQLP